MGFLKFSHGMESEADMLGLEYMYKAGHDPEAFVDFFEKIETLEKRKPGTVAKVFPFTSDDASTGHSRAEKTSGAIVRSHARLLLTVRI